MHAHVGDRMVVKATHLDEPVRDGRILEVHGEGGEPPFLVEWSDTGHVTLLYPGPDSFIDHLGHDPRLGPQQHDDAPPESAREVLADEADVLEQTAVVDDDDDGDYPHDVSPSPVDRS